jgi:23S rRNA pseudouridine1911/1915/1917 synthase
VNDVTSAKNTPILQVWLKGNYDYPLSKDSKFRSGIVHRLDKETSGLLLIAKTTKSFRALQSQFKKRQVGKTYKALVHGIVEPKKGVVQVPVGRLPWSRKKFGVIPGGRGAETNYSVIRYYQRAQEKFSLLKLNPKTGRTHQIRVHLKYLKHPIVSDPFYAGRKTARRDRKWCLRLFLHASSISFKHPTSQKNMEFKSRLPKDLKSALAKLKKLQRQAQ